MIQKQLSVSPLNNLVYLSLFVAAILYMNAASAQYENLHKLKGSQTEVYYSSGHKERAADIANRTDKAIDFNHNLLNFKPHVILLVLSVEDWNKYTNFPVYGIPHYKC